MKTIIAVVAAGLIGGGAAIGAIAGGLVSVPQAAAAKPGTSPHLHTEEHSADKAEDHEAEIARLRTEIENLKVVKPSSGLSESEVKRLVKSEYDRMANQAPPAAKSADGESKPVESPKSVEEQFVRDVYAKIEAERVEQRRLDRQAARIAQLEETKKTISESVPTFLKNQATRLQLSEAQIGSLTPALTTYLHQRAEVRSEAQGERIDGKDVDNAAVDEKLKALETTTMSVVNGIVSEETATSLMRSVLRLGGGMTRGMEAPGAAPGSPNPRGDGGTPRQRRGGGNNN